MIFCSYATEDRDFLDTGLFPRLQSAGFKVWRDRDYIPLATEIEPAVKAALENCKRVLLIMTNFSASSNWVRWEVDWTLRNRPGCLVPVLLRDCQIDAFHLGVAGLNIIDLRKPNNDAFGWLCDSIKGQFEAGATLYVNFQLEISSNGSFESFGGLGLRNPLPAGEGFRLRIRTSKEVPCLVFLVRKNGDFMSVHPTGDWKGAAALPAIRSLTLPPDDASWRVEESTGCLTVVGLFMTVPVLDVDWNDLLEELPAMSDAELASAARVTQWNAAEKIPQAGRASFTLWQRPAVTVRSALHQEIIDRFNFCCARIDMVTFRCG